jgi:Flp pilus assembly protein TadG
LNLEQRNDMRKTTKIKGQALPLVAVLILALLAVVGLAIDGGTLFTERRRAQNAADGASLAGARTMLELYQQMIRSYSTDVDGTSAQEQVILAAIRQYAARNGVNTNVASNLKAYFVSDSKQVVTAQAGNSCGLSTPCQVGSNGGVPWTRGAKGIWVTNSTESASFFMAVFGWNRLSATASATAYMGVATETNPGIGILPIGFFTDTESLRDLVVGNTYTLINGSTRQGSGNWGYIDFNDNGNSASVVNAMIACGFNPALLTSAQWQQWCTNPDYQGEDRAVGPAVYWTGGAGSLNGPYTSTRIDWNAGWWLAGSSGTTNSTCQVFEDLSSRIVGREYLIPVFDTSNGQGGENTKFHLIGLAWFLISDADIECHPRQGQEQHWSIEGEFIQRYSAGSSGGHGDVRRTSNPVVFLEP